MFTASDPTSGVSHGGITRHHQTGPDQSSLDAPESDPDPDPDQTEVTCWFIYGPRDF